MLILENAIISKDISCIVCNINYKIKAFISSFDNAHNLLMEWAMDEYVE